jgi:hypothetical protein
VKGAVSVHPPPPPGSSNPSQLVVSLCHEALVGTAPGGQAAFRALSRLPPATRRA